jgi:hypothetical protein
MVPAKSKGQIDKPTGMSIDQKQINVFLFSAMKTKCQASTKFVFVHQKLINDNHLQQPRHMWDDSSTRLERGIYWVQPNGKGGSRCWNLVLLRSVLAFGMESQQHRDLMAEYATLPTAA